MLGDVTGDGRLDIVTANYDAQNVGVRPGLAAGGFGPGHAYAVSPSNTPIDVALGDLNADGRLDIVALNLYSSDASVLLNTGTYLATAPATPASDLLVYPNPAPDCFTVQLPTASNSGLIQAELLDARGTAVWRRLLPGAAVRQGASVSTAGLPAGVYVLRLTTPTTSLVRRVVVP